MVPSETLLFVLNTQRIKMVASDNLVVTTLMFMTYRLLYYTNLAKIVIYSGDGTGFETEYRRVITEVLVFY